MSGPEAVKVIIRCRPMNKREKGLKSQVIFTMIIIIFNIRMVKTCETSMESIVFLYSIQFNP